MLLNLIFYFGSNIEFRPQQESGLLQLVNNDDILYSKIITLIINNNRFVHQKYVVPNTVIDFSHRLLRYIELKQQIKDEIDEKLVNQTTSNVSNSNNSNSSSNNFQINGNLSAGQSVINNQNSNNTIHHQTNITNITIVGNNPQNS